MPDEDPESRRAIDDISLEELGNAAAWALSQYFTVVCSLN